jgi:prepilin-type N-terminal cleavage/methylation domain-containing protein
MMHPQKNILHGGKRAFTLIELLVVIAIIGILAGLLMTGIMGVKAKAMVGRAKTEVASLVSAVTQYEASYSMPPCSKKVWDSSKVNANNADYTYGTTTNAAIPGTLLRTDYLRIVSYGTPNYVANNSEVVAVLRNAGTLPALANLVTALNPKKVAFLEVSDVNNNIYPGVGTDGVYRDPWGNPYIISLDMDASGTTTDGFYRNLIESKVRTAKPNNPAAAAACANYPLEMTGSVLVWSLGPDGKADPNPDLTTPAGKDAIEKGPKGILQFGDNKDNVLSWEP